MKLGIITFFRMNYGAVLQAYALQTVLKSLGQSPEIMDYSTIRYQSSALFTSWTNVKEIALNIFKIYRYRQFKKRIKRFTGFEARNLNVSREKFFYSKELLKSISRYDAFICGSDQVWRPRKNNDRNRAYFLGFVKKDQAVKISYAPSFGVSSIPKTSLQEIKAWIDDIPNLSVREEVGRAIIDKVSGRKARVVLDPTLLLEKSYWDQIAKPTKIVTPYILVYSTSQRGLFPKLVKHIKKSTGLSVVVLSLYSLNLIPMADRVIYDAGPSEFLYLFANATCVCTNSFHGIAFSIIYQKPFWSVPHNVTNSRIADLLKILNLSSRQLSDQSQFPKSPLEIDYSKSVSLLDRKKIQSKNFLITALQRK